MPSQIWAWQGGTDEGDYVKAGAIATDGSIVLAGYTYGDWSSWDIAEGSEDFAAVKIDSSGTLLWKWQYGTASKDRFDAVAAGEDGSVFLAGQSGGDFSVALLDANGSLSWVWQGGTVDDEDCAWGMTMLSDSSVVVAGHTRGDWGDVGVHAGAEDFAALRVLSDGSVLWKWQNGTSKTDILYGVSVADNDEIFLAGYTEGDFTTSASSDGADSAFVAIKLDPNGTEMWRWQDGPAAGSGELTAAAATADGGVVLVGWAQGDWGAPSAGSVDFAAVKLGPDGQEVWRWQDGTTEDDQLKAVSVQSDGDVVIAGSTYGDWDGENAGFTDDFAVITLDGDGQEIWRWQGGSTGDDDMEAVVTDVGGRIALAGYTNGVWEGSESNLGSNDFVVVVLNATQVSSEQDSPASGSTLIAVGIVVAVAVVAVGALTAAGFCTRKRRRAKKKAKGSPSSTASGVDDVEDTPFHSPEEDGGTLSGASSYILGESSHPPLSIINSGRAASSGSLCVADAMIEAATELARSCPVPGVSEAATLMSTLTKLVSDSRDNSASNDNRLRRCRSIITMLNSAAEILGQDGVPAARAERELVDDVGDAIADFAGLIKTYKSKNKLSKVLTSSLFKRRQEEADAVVHRALTRLNFSMLVHNSVKSVAEDGSPSTATPRLSEAEHALRLKAESHRRRRQRKLDKAEIPPEEVIMTKELLGKGAFGSVYIVDYNGRNAAAKVVEIDHGLAGLSEGDAVDEPDGSPNGRSSAGHESRQRRAFLRELDAMIRLRSPHTVHVYGKITTTPDQLVIVMELLVGGDLRMLLKSSSGPLPEHQSLGIVADVCAGMEFLHSNETVHGDLKSANVLLDGAGRAKIADFGTSRWTQHTNSTGLATYTTEAGQKTQMTFAWSAPEVLDGGRSTYASDVYSFGVLVWEIMTAELPWGGKERPRDIMCAVLKGERPVFPETVPRGIADVAMACWAADPNHRPTFRAVMKDCACQSWSE